MTKVGRREETSIESRASAFCEPFSGICQRVERTEREQPFFIRFLPRILLVGKVDTEKS